jgi:hypothetical protein
MSMATRASRFPAAIAVVGPPERRSCWSPTIFPTMFCCSTPRRAQSRSASIFPRAMPCLRPIPSRWRFHKTAHRAFVALWNASEIVELDFARESGRKLALLKPASPVAPGTHPCALEFSPDGRRCTSRWRIAMPLRPSMWAGPISVKGLLRHAACRGRVILAPSRGAGI